MAVKKFELVERPQYYVIVFGTLHILRIPKRENNINKLHDLTTSDKTRARRLVKTMNERREIFLNE